MTDLLKELSERAKALAGNWSAYTVVGSFVLYVLGYLALRFHLTAVGAGTDLSVLDERYLFTGAKFLVYLAATVPSALLVVLLAGALAYGPYRALPPALRDAFGRAQGWLREPRRLAATGIVLSVLGIQFLMRDCFEFGNLLLRARPPDGTPLARWMRHEDEGRIALFFVALVLAVGTSALILIVLRMRPLDGRVRWATQLLGALVALQVLMLPVNYGYLVLDKSLPRVTSLDGIEPLPAHTEAWLVWEGKDGVTFLTRRHESQGERRALLTLPRAEVKRIEITAYDRIVPTLFGHPASASP
jgi:hypothetical protein